MYLAYARYHRAVTDNDPRVAPTARILVVENAWRTYGLGHMARGVLCCGGIHLTGTAFSIIVKKAARD